MNLGTVFFVKFEESSDGHKGVSLKISLQKCSSNSWKYTCIVQLVHKS